MGLSILLSRKPKSTLALQPRQYALYLTACLNSKAHLKWLGLGSKAGSKVNYGLNCDVLHWKQSGMLTISLQVIPRAGFHSTNNDKGV